MRQRGHSFYHFTDFVLAERERQEKTEMLETRVKLSITYMVDSHHCHRHHHHKTDEEVVVLLMYLDIVVV